MAYSCVLSPLQRTESTMIPTLDPGPYLAQHRGPGCTGGRASLHPGAHRVLYRAQPRRAARDRRGPYEALRRFFALPLKDKLKLKINRTSVGYVPIRSTVYVTSKFNTNTRKDLNETLTLARERPADDPDIQRGLRFVGPNQWPEGLTGFRDAMIAYQEALAGLGHAMLPLYALALDLPGGYFEPYFTRPTWWTRNTYYPALVPEENQFGISPHSDHGFITLLPMSTVAGLQI